MSHNPTYDPEPGYTSYGGDRSGQSTPPNLYTSSTLPVADSGPYTNMASYRQATSGPPGSDMPAGNGKSYRYATEPIPEDDGEASSPVADSRQVQFSDLGEKNNMAKNSRGRLTSGGSEGGLANKKFLIMVVLAIVFALLWVIFMGLYLSVVVNQSTDTGTTAAGNVGAAQGGDNGKPTSPPPTTAPPIPSEEMGRYPDTDAGKMVYKYTLSNNNIEVEVLTLGARLFAIKSGSRTVVRGYAAGGNMTDVTAIANDAEGAWQGPVCGNNPDYHQKHFTMEPTSDGSLKLKAELNSVAVVFTYTLNNGKLMVHVTGTPIGNNVATPMDICVAQKFNLNNNGIGDITNSHSLQVYAERVYGSSENWDPVGGLNDFKSLKGVSEAITTIQRILPEQTSIADSYRLIGPTGMRQGAIVKGSGASPQVKIDTNQRVMFMSINLKDTTAIELRAQNFEDGSTDAETDRISLRSGSTYEYAISYTIS